VSQLPSLQYSEDRQWFWTGYEWLRTSPDGRSVWDGVEWKPLPPIWIALAIITDIERHPKQHSPDALRFQRNVLEILVKREITELEDAATRESQDASVGATPTSHTDKQPPASSAQFQDDPDWGRKTTHGLQRLPLQWPTKEELEWTPDPAQMEEARKAMANWPKPPTADEARAKAEEQGREAARRLHGA
jgi:hypothetical protein